MLAHSGDAEGDVVVEGEGEFGGAFLDVVAADVAGEGFVLEAFFDGGGFEVEDAFGGADVGTGDIAPKDDGEDAYGAP